MFTDQQFLSQNVNKEWNGVSSAFYAHVYTMIKVLLEHLRCLTEDLVTIVFINSKNSKKVKIVFRINDGMERLPMLILYRLLMQ